MKTKILQNSLLKSRNDLVKKFLKIQAVPYLSLKTVEQMTKRIDDLMELEEAIKQYDILIGLAKKCSVSFSMVSLCVNIQPKEEDFKPELAKLSDWEEVKKAI